MHIAEKLGAEGAKKHSLTDRMEFRKKSNQVPASLFGTVKWGTQQAALDGLVLTQSIRIFGITWLATALGLFPQLMRGEPVEPSLFDPPK